MNSWLAQIYGTGGAQEADLEKTAQSMLLQKLAEQEGLSLEGMTPEQIDALAAEVLTEDGGEGGSQAAGGQQGMVAQAGEGPSEEEAGEEEAGEEAAGGEEEITKEAQQKFEEADFLGRVMAHAYTQELEKIASTKTAGVPGPAGIGRKVSNFALKAKMKGRAAAQDAGKAVQEHVGKHKKKYIGGAAAAGAAGAFGAGRMSKEASPILNKLAEIRAREILAENGINPDTGEAAAQQAEQGTGQAAAPGTAQQQVQQQVNDRAVQLLKEAGYTFQ